MFREGQAEAMSGFHLGDVTEKKVLKLKWHWIIVTDNNDKLHMYIGIAWYWNWISGFWTITAYW